jgi:cytochrome P450
MIYEISYFLGCLFLLSVAYYTQLFIRQCIMLKKFKGPFALPFVGNCYDMETIFMMRYVSKLRKRFGKVFTFFLFTKPYVVVCEPVAVRRILSDTKAFPKGKDYSDTFSIAFGLGLVTSNGEKHKADRAIFGKYFVRSNIAKFMGTINSLCVEAMDQYLVQKDHKPHCHNIEEFFATLALRTFALFGMNFDYRKHPEKERALTKTVSEGSLGLAQMVFLNLPAWNIIPQVAKIRKARTEVWRDLQDAIAQKREQLARGETPDDCLAAMLAEHMSDEDMLDHISTLISAGHDTTAYFSSYFAYLLGQYPLCQDRIRDEMRSVLGDRLDVTADDVAEMKYLHKAMQECLRLYAIIPNVIRRSAEDVHIKEANITIPKDTNLLIPLFLMNRDPDIWENPSEFDPDRFEGKGNEYTSAKNGFFPFGYGSRTCIGNTLAQLESAVFFCHILRKYHIDADPGFKPNIMSGISLTTSNGINIILKEL